MSCKAGKIKGCEIKGSSFDGTTLVLQDRDLINDTFFALVKDYKGTLLTTLEGAKNLSTVFFSFTELEGFKVGNYSIEYWGNLHEVGKELIAVEDFYISDKVCDCSDKVDNTFVLDFGGTAIDVIIQKAVVNIALDFDSLTPEQKAELKGDDGVGIDNVVLNPNYTLTIHLTDGTSYTTESIRGSKGEDGNDGDDGVGISNIVLNSDYTLTISLTDGTSYTTASIRGLKGEDGVSAGFGTPTANATTLESNQSATVSVSASGNNTNKVFAFSFGIPKGIKGDNGLSAGFGTPTATATTLNPTDNATVSVSASGVDTAKVFSFVFGIPKGDKGDNGTSVLAIEAPDEASAEALSTANPNNLYTIA